jgi:hypothetical protein
LCPENEPMTKTRPTRSNSRGHRVVLALALVGCSALAFGSSPAFAAKAVKDTTPCWKKVVNDWFRDGRIDGTYPVSCYSEATQHIGDDAKQYSSFGDDARRALLGAMRLDRPNGPGGGALGGTSSGGSSPGPGPAAPAPSGGTDSTSPGGSTPTTTPVKGPITRAIDWLGPSNAESIPLPLMILAAIALLLLAAALASFVARRIQARRVQPRPAPARGPDRP